VKRLLLAMVVTILSVRGAAAAEGGPVLAGVLGWDGKLQRVYVQILHTDDDEYTPTLWYFDLKSDRPAAPQLVDWSGGEVDDLHATRLAHLRRGLRPLHADEGTRSVLDAGAPAPWDSVESDVGHARRYVVRLVPGAGPEPALRVLTLDPGRHAVRSLREYAIPRTTARLAILSTEAVPLESGYEVQFPVLLGAGPGVADPIDPRAFDVRK
jgi:hypothetical protein